MKTIIHLVDTKISSLISLSSRVIMTETSDPFDSHYRFETSLCSMDDRIRSRTFTWCSSTEYFKSFRLFQFTVWIHKRISKRIRYRLQRFRILKEMAMLQTQLNSIESNKPSDFLIPEGLTLNNAGCKPGGQTHPPNRNPEGVQQKPRQPLASP